MSELPVGFQERMKELLGDEYWAFEASYLEERSQGLRFSSLKLHGQEAELRHGEASGLWAVRLAQQVAKKAGFSLRPVPWVKEGFYYGSQDRPGKHPYHEAGVYYIQEPSAMAVVELLEPLPGDSVLDLCAAPGGKTFHAADRLKGAGKVLSRDLTEYKTELIEENKDRMHYENVEVQQWDALEEDESLLESVDVLLADLPCSGLGIMGRKNDIKYQMTEEQLGELAALQRQILSVVWKYVKPGGQMIFSTCTLNKGENAENIKWIEENTPLHLVSIEEYLPQNLKNRTGSQGYLQLIPGEDTCDGFFISKFKRPEAK